MKVTPETIEPNFYAVGDDFANQLNIGSPVSAKDDADTTIIRQVVNVNNVPTQPPHYNIVPSPAGSIVSVGKLASANNGWGIQADGKAYFSDIDIGNHYVTVDVGESIQDAIDSLIAGGIVVVRNGTHTVAYDINLKSGVYLVGENRNSSIIDFATGNYSIKCIGSGVYSTGTISVSNGGTIVTGDSTSWDGNVSAGQSILINGIWYVITAVDSDTSIDISLPFVGDDITGASYRIATPVYDVWIKDLTIKNSGQDGIQWQDVNLSMIGNLVIQGCNVGMEWDYVSSCTIDVCNAYGNNYGYNFANVYYSTWFSGGDADSLTGNAITLNTVSNCKFDSLFVLNPAGDGFNITSCSNCLFTGISCSEAGGQGIELVSGNSALIFSGFASEYNASDGIKLTATSDNCFFSNASIKSNGGYGINIAASTCDNNVITSNTFTSNTLGAISDGGTGTKKSGNVGVDDTLQLLRNFVSGENLTAGDAVYVKSEFIGGTGTGNSGSGQPSISITTLYDNSWILDMVWMATADAGTFTPGTGQTEKWDVRDDADGGGCSTGSYKLQATAGATTMTHTFSAGARAYQAAACEIRKKSGSSLAFDAVTEDLQDGASITFSHTCTGSDRILYVCCGQNANTETVTSITYGGVAMTKIIEGTTSAYAVIYGLVAPATGANDVVITWSDAPGSGKQAHFAISFTGAHQEIVISKVFQADASASATADAFIGFAKSSVTKPAELDIVVSGVYQGFTNLTVGSKYYLSDTTAAISTSAGTVHRGVGIGLSSTDLLITNIWDIT